MSSPSVHIYLLGRFEIVRDQRILKADAWSRRKAALLLQLLALERRAVKDQVIETLWPESAAEFGREQSLSDSPYSPSELSI